jgi:hypothetical protein
MYAYLNICSYYCISQCSEWVLQDCLQYNISCIYQTKSVLSYSTLVSIPVIFFLAEITLATARHNVLCTISGSHDSEVSYLISNFCRVLNIVCFLLGISPASNFGKPILPAAHNKLQLLGSFTCPKVGTWDRLLDFPSEGRHAEEFYIRKIRRLRWLACWPLVSEFAGSNPAEAVGFFWCKNPQHAFLRRGSQIICPMSQLWGM